jgi:hypothetical protein
LGPTPDLGAVVEGGGRDEAAFDEIADLVIA